MAANPKTLRIVDAHAAGPATRVLHVECIDGEALEAVGGKYIIVHTGLVVGDRAVKRAYSLVPVAGAKGRAALLIKRLDGAGSPALHAAAVGTTLGFSGPWGKLVPEDGLAERTLLVATDTGVTSALGIVAQAALDGTRRPLELLWLHAADETFLDPADVRARVEDAGVRFTRATIPGVTDPDRTRVAWEHVEARAAEISPTHVVATGDGAVVHPLRTRLAERVASVRDVRVECFFRNPEKKSV